MAVFSSMDQVLKHTVESVLTTGAIVSPRGNITREILGYSFVLSNPRARIINLRSRRWSFSFAVGELCWHFSGSDSLEFIDYYSKAWKQFSKDGIKICGSCYGNKIFGGDNPQWIRIKDMLTSDPFSRRAVITLYNAEDELEADSVDIACITSIQFIIRDGRLNCICTMRSNDVIWGLCYDVFLVTMLQERMALELGLKLGWYKHNAASMHIYERHFDMADKILIDQEPSENTVMDPMESLEDINLFLQIEEGLRRGDPGAYSSVKLLSSYWKGLAKPLVQKAGGDLSSDVQ